MNVGSGYILSGLNVGERREIYFKNTKAALIELERSRKKKD